MSMTMDIGDFTIGGNTPVTFYFQYLDADGKVAVPTSAPKWRIYSAATNSEITATGTDLVTAGFTGQYYGEFYANDYDGAQSTLNSGSYILKIYLPNNDAGQSTHALYFFRAVAQDKFSRFESPNFIANLHDEMYNEMANAGGLGDLIETRVWDAAKLDHSVAATFGDNSLSGINKTALLSALSISDDTASATLDNMKAILDVLQAVSIGRWKINVTNKTLTFYQLDGVTPLIVFNLLDSGGDPSTSNVAERAPV